jgi:NADPH:quinone reductase-like Zn-dependent oxidoreductase
MRAVIFRAHGGPEVLEHTEVSDPKPGPGQILVRVRACSVNRLDIWIRQGIPAYSISLPHISGCDVAGTVEQVGAGVAHPKPGEAVVLSPGLSCGECALCRNNQDSLCPDYGIRGAKTDGGYAQLALAEARDALALPKGITFESAAAFPLVFLTAWHMLVGRAGLKAGETVLIHAAGSGVGHAGIQIAKHMGARVITTVGSQEKVSRAQALGADAVINYKTEPVQERAKALTDGRGVDVVLDHIGPDVWETSLRSLAKGGRLVTCGATSGPQALLDLRYVFSRQLSILGSMMGSRAELGQLMGLLANGRLKPVVDQVFPLKEARTAQEKMLSRNFFGKLVLAA